MLLLAASQCPLHDRRSDQGSDNHHDDYGGKGGVIDYPKAFPDAGKNKADFAPGNHSHADAQPVQSWI